MLYANHGALRLTNSSLSYCATVGFRIEGKQPDVTGDNSTTIGTRP